MCSLKSKTAPVVMRNGHLADSNAIKKLRVSKQQQKLRQSFFTNILLLGFDREAREKKDYILYNENMFAVPNNKGALPVLYFLMEKLDPEEVKTRFKGIWPVFDKKQEQYFRKELCNWLNKIVQEDPEAGFNSIYPSLFLSPGGYKFEQFLFYLSRYVLLKTLKKQCNIKDGYLRCPTLKPSLPQMVHIPKILKCATVKHIQSLLVNIEENQNVYKMWHEAIKKLTEEYKSQYKTICYMKSRLKNTEEEEKKAKENWEGTDDSRNEVINLVKDQWKDILHQIQSQDADRETIQSVIKSFESKHKLDMQTINASIPDQLLQVKEQQIQEGKVHSLYREGKLDIVSLLKLSNLSLQMYYENLQSADVSDCKESISEFEMLSEKHSKFLENIEKMRQEMTETLEKSKDSVYYLTEKLNDNSDKVNFKSLDFKMIPHSPPPRNLLLMPVKQEHQTQTERSILDSTNVLNSEEEAMKILKAAAAVVQNCTEQKPVNLLAAVKKNTMLPEDLSELKTFECNIKQTKPSSKLLDPTNNHSSLSVYHSTDQTSADVNKKIKHSKSSAKHSHEKAMKDYASSVVDYYKNGGKADLQDVSEALSVDAFQSKDKLARSPIGKLNKQKRSSKDSGIDESKSDLFPQSPNSLNHSDPISTSPLLTPNRVSHGSADLNSLFLPSLMLPMNTEDLDELFTLPDSKCISLSSENAGPFDSIPDDASIQFEQPGCQNSSGEEINQSDYYTPLKKGLNLIGQSVDCDFQQTNSKSLLVDSMEYSCYLTTEKPLEALLVDSMEYSCYLTTEKPLEALLVDSMEYSCYLTTEKPLEEESDSILVD